MNSAASHESSGLIGSVRFALVGVAAAGILKNSGRSTSRFSCQILGSTRRSIFKFLLYQMCNVLGGIVVELVKGMVENAFVFVYFQRRRDFTLTVDGCWTRCSNVVVEHVEHNSVLHDNVDS